MLKLELIMKRLNLSSGLWWKWERRLWLSPIGVGSSLTMMHYMLMAPSMNIVVVYLTSGARLRKVSATRIGLPNGCTSLPVQVRPTMKELLLILFWWQQMMWLPRERCRSSTPMRLLLVTANGLPTKREVGISPKDASRYVRWWVWLCRRESHHHCATLLKLRRR